VSGSRPGRAPELIFAYKELPSVRSTDEDGEIVDEEECDTSGGTSSFFLWHSTGYSRGLRPGTTLDGGQSFPAGDRKSRRAFGLPAAGQVGNGTVKTNVVGRGSGSSGISSGTSGG
jgi:hypothetical protein